MEMYNYALLQDNGVCHSIYQSSNEITDIPSKTIAISEYTERYLNALWTGSEWDYPPSQNHTWNGSEWVSVLVDPFESSLLPEDSEIMKNISNAVLQEYINAGRDLEDPAVDVMGVEESKRRFKEQTGREFQI
jgi:hypothetical protein